MKLFRPLFLLGTWLLFVSSPTLAQSVLLNEMVTSNGQYSDDDGDTPDWFELRNTSATQADLTNWTITDDPEQPDRWIFPEIILPADGYLKIWASAKDRTTVGSARTLVRPQNEFRYLVPNSAVSSDWRTVDFDDSSWPTGSAGFGYGDGDDVTELPDGTISVFLRTTFTLTNPSTVTELLLDIDYDDAFVAYLNGTEVARANISGAFPPFDALAPTDREAQVYAGGAPVRFSITDLSSLLLTGENVLSIQVHNISEFSSDLTLRPWLTAIFNTVTTTGVPPPSLLNIPSYYCLHTNFKLSAGETLYLFDDQASFVDSLVSGPLPPDQSIGRLLNEPTEIRLFNMPSPAAPNPEDGLLGALAPTIVFSAAGGPLTEATMLTLSGVNAPNEIRFTLDATPPNAGSELYEEPILIDENTVVRAAIFQENYWPSPIQTESYLLNAAHELPIISLVTAPENFFDNDTGIYVLGDDYVPSFPYFGANFWQNWERPIHLSFYEPDGSLGTSFDAGVKIFGGWSRANPQRSLSIFARGQYGTSKIDYPFFSRLPFQEFQAVVLRNAGNDFLRGNFRDIIITSLLSDADIETQSYRSCATYLNGEYWGLYHLREKINEHFLADRYGLDPAEIDLLEANSATIQGSNDDYVALLDFVTDNDLGNNSNFAQVADQIDIDNFILYYLTQIYFNNTDWPGNNIKYWRPQGGKWRWILFDTDFALGAWDFGKYENNTLDFALESNGPGWPNPPWSTLLFRNVIENTGFLHRFINRFADEMNTRFLPTRVIEHIDTLQASIIDEIPRHFEHWEGDLYDIYHWEINVTWIRNFVERRPPYMKQHILNQFDLPDYHELQLTNQTPERGYIQLNSLKIEASNWAGDYFENVPVSLEAVPRPGYAFSHWLGSSSSTNAEISLNVNQLSQLEAVFVFSNEDYIVINEINYNSSDDRPTGDWIELHNPTPTDNDISAWTIRDDDNDEDHLFILPAGTVIPAQGYLVIARNLTDFTTYHSELENVIGEFDFGFGSNGDAVRLFDVAGDLHDIVVYSPDAPWPTAANGQGPTLELLDAVLDNSLPESWANVHPFGSPGAINTDDSAVEEVSIFQEFSYYPNPSEGVLSLAFTLNKAQQMAIRLYDVNGRLVQQLFENKLNAGAHTQSYMLEELPAGAYLLELCVDQRACVSRKWVKSR